MSSPMEPEGNGQNLQGELLRPIPMKGDGVEDLGNCGICQQRADGVHFSVVSCRACAAFFRRTVILSMTYTCKENGNCTVEKSMRNVCRSCRYTRCINEGMKTERYDLFLKFRKSTETLVQHTVITATPSKFAKLELHASRFDSAKQVCKVEAHLVTDIVNTYFSPFSILKFEDKVALFKNFFCYFSHTDRAYQSFKQFESDNANDKILMPDGGFIKRSELDRFYENSQGVHTSPEDAAKIFQPAFNYILDVIVDYMRRIRIIETEYLALLGFCLWDDAVPGLSDEAKSLAVKTQAQLLAELQNFYSSQNKTPIEITQRIGTLLLLVPKLTKCVIMLRENSVLAELFNYYEADVCCKNFKEDASVDLDCNDECIAHTKPSSS